MANTLSALKRVQEISNKRDADSYKGDELWADVGEGSIQTVEDAHQEDFIGENCFEEVSHFLNLSFLSEGRVEEDVTNQIDKLNLHNILFVENDLMQNFEQILHYVFDQLFAKNRIINVVQQGFDKFDSRSIHSWVTDVKLDSHTFDGVAFDVLDGENDQ